MRALAVKLILILFGLLLPAEETPGVLSVVSLLTAVTFTSFCGYFQSKRFIQVCCFVYFGISTVVPAFCPFLPLFCFDLFAFEPRTVTALALIPLLASLSRQIYSDTTFLFMLVMLALLLRYMCDKIARLESDNIQIRDNSREQSRILTLQNKHLIETQDYEIHLATLQERNRIAREIHDNVGHILSRSLLQAGALQTLNKNEQLAAHLSGLKDTLSLAMDSIRGSVHDIKDEAVDLRDALTQMLTFDEYEIRLDYDISNIVPNEIKYCFISTMKEALTNITKHSDATAIRVTVQEHPALYQLLIHDNGTQKPYSQGDGMGISNMGERVKALNGYFVIDYQNGFRIFISIPKQEETSQ